MNATGGRMTGAAAIPFRSGDIRMNSGSSIRFCGRSVRSRAPAQGVKCERSALRWIRIPFTNTVPGYVVFPVYEIAAHCAESGSVHRTNFDIFAHLCDMNCEIRLGKQRCQRKYTISIAAHLGAAENTRLGFDNLAPPAETAHVKIRVMLAGHPSVAA